jgi:hypothetical protein
MLEVSKEDETSFPHKETTEAIIGAAFEVYNQLGYGFLERVYDADLIVDNCVAVEIKVSPQYDKRDEAQLLNELKATGLKVGVLVNFGRAKVEFRRLVF